MDKKKEFKNFMNKIQIALDDFAISDYCPPTYINNITKTYRNIYTIDHITEVNNSFLIRKHKPQVIVNLDSIELDQEYDISTYRTLAVIIDDSLDSEPYGHITCINYDTYPYHFLLTLIKKTNTYNDVELKQLLQSEGFTSDLDEDYIGNSSNLYFSVLKYKEDYLFYRLPPMRVTINKEKIPMLFSLENFINTCRDNFICLYKIKYPQPIYDVREFNGVGMFYFIGDLRK